MNRSTLPCWTVLNAGFANVGTEWRYRHICSPFTRLYYISAGKGYLEMSDRTVILEPGRFYIIPAFTTHSTRCFTSMSHYYIHVYEATGDSESSILESYRFPDGIEASEGMIQIFKEIIERNKEKYLREPDPQKYDTYKNMRSLIEHQTKYSDGDLLINNGILSILMGFWLKAGDQNLRPRDARIIKVVEFIHKNYLRRFSVDDCASVVSLSQYHLLRLFKKVIGTTLMNYVQELKIRKAQTELVLSSKSIKEISVDLDYTDVNYFIRQFKQHTGITPGLYRRLNMS